MQQSRARLSQLPLRASVRRAAAPLPARALLARSRGGVPERVATEKKPPIEPAPPAADDDKLLVGRAQAGDGRAFQTLVERYQRRVVQLALSMVKDPDEALDIAQETFVRVHRFLPSFKGDSSFYTWTFRIAANLCLDAARKKSRRPMVALDDASDELEATLDPVSHALAGPQRLTLNRELQDQLHEALQQLPEKHRAILLLRELDGLSYEELSQTLGIRKGTVMSRLFHARLKMQRLLRGYLGDDAPGPPAPDEEDEP